MLVSLLIAWLVTAVSLYLIALLSQFTELKLRISKKP